MSIRYERPLPDVIHIIAESQFELTTTFVRAQEHYESPYDDIRGAKFTLDQLAARYVKDGKDFDYFSKWNGMNMPSVSYLNWLAGASPLRPEESKLVCAVQHAINQGVNPRHFYLIGTWKNEDITHELSHALWDLDPAYRNAQCENITRMRQNNIQSYDIIERWLLDVRGYSKTVIPDEVAAYMATSGEEYLRRKMGSEQGLMVALCTKPFEATWTKFSGLQPYSPEAA